MCLPQTLQIILNGQDFDSLSEAEQQRYIKMALCSLYDEYRYGIYSERQKIKKDIEILENMKKTVV